MKKRFTGEQIVTILKEGEAGVPVKEICRKHGISDATFYTWQKKFGNMEGTGNPTPKAARGRECQAQACIG